MKRFWCTRCGGWQHAVISVNKLTVIIPSNGLMEKKQQNEWRRSAERLSVMSLRMNYSLFESEWVQMCVVLSGFLRFFFPPPEKHVFRSLKTSRVTHVTLVLWIGNETLRASRFGNASCVTESEALIESCQFIGWWRDAVSDAITSSAYTDKRAIHSDFSAEKNPVGSVRSLAAYAASRSLFREQGLHE